MNTSATIGDILKVKKQGIAMAALFRSALVINLTQNGYRVRWYEGPGARDIMEGKIPFQDVDHIRGRLWKAVNGPRKGSLEFLSTVDKSKVIEATAL